jgi:hypothetical protein
MVCWQCYNITVKCCEMCSGRAGLTGLLQVWVWNRKWRIYECHTVRHAHRHIMLQSHPWHAAV